MANTIATQILNDGHKNCTVKINVTGDGSGEETVALVVDVSALTPAASRVTIDAVTYSLDGFSASLIWDATTDKLALAMVGTGFLNFNYFGGIPNDAAATVTGDVLLATNGLGTGEKGTIIIEMTKTLAVV